MSSGKDWTWTAPADSMTFRADRLGQVDGIEIAGCVDLGGGTVERTESADAADFHSVYFHRPQEGADCIADRNTLAEATEHAREWAVKLKVPLYVYGEPETWPHLESK